MFLTREYSVFPIIHVIFVLGRVVFVDVCIIGIICVMSPIDDNLMMQIDFGELVDLRHNLSIITKKIDNQIYIL